jgi:hypothetical protein
MNHHRLFTWAVIVLLSALSINGTIANEQPEIVNDAPRPHIAVPLTNIMPLVTAVANDPAWNKAAVIPLIIPSLSTSPPPIAPILKTEIRLLWDPGWLYVRFLCHDDKIYLPVHGRDAPIYKGDAVEVFIDPIGDCREWIELEFNAANDVFDQITLCTGEPKWDRSFRLTNEVIAQNIWTFPYPDFKNLRSAAAPWKINSQTVGWIVDVAIPAAGILKRTGLKQLQIMSLRGDFLRYKMIPKPTGDKRDLLSLTWSPIVIGIPHRCPAAFGFIDLSAAIK